MRTYASSASSSKLYFKKSLLQEMMALVGQFYGHACYTQSMFDTFFCETGKMPVIPY